MTEPTQLIEQLASLLKRYRTETPLGHQPYLIAETVDGVLPDARAHLEQPTEASAAMGAQGEVDEYQYREKPTWDANAQWSNWTKCNRGSFEDYKRTPMYNNWIYEVRTLYTHPQATEPAPSISQLVAALNPNSFKELVQRGANLWPDAPAEIKEFADLVTAGQVMQDYKAQEHKRKTINSTLEN